MSLSQGFIQHASLEAIEADLQAAVKRRNASVRQVDELMALLRERLSQIEEGTWPVDRVADEAGG